MHTGLTRVVHTVAVSMTESVSLDLCPSSITSTPAVLAAPAATRWMCWTCQKGHWILDLVGPACGTSRRSSPPDWSSGGRGRPCASGSLRRPLPATHRATVLHRPGLQHTNTHMGYSTLYTLPPTEQKPWATTHQYTLTMTLVHYNKQQYCGLRHFNFQGEHITSKGEKTTIE